MGKAKHVLGAGVVLLGALAAWGADTAPAPNPASGSHVSPADRYVRAVYEAELAGNEALRTDMLAHALTADPNSRAARWLSGYVAFAGKWMTEAETAHRYSVDPRLIQYRQRRDAAASAGLLTRGTVFGSVGGTSGSAVAARGSSVDTYRTGALTPAGIAANVELARWCRGQQLVDEERAHWTQVLYDDPTNTEAQARLGMRWYKGSLLTAAQISSIEKQQALEARQLAQWKPTVARWRGGLNGGSPGEQTQVRVEIKAATDPDVIPALESAILADAPKSAVGRESATSFQHEAIALLGRFGAQRATFSLVQVSVLANQAAVRSAAADELKKRPLHDFVPVLLAGLANPIQFDYSLSFDPTLGLAIYRAVAAQEGRDTITRVEYSNSTAGLLPMFVGSHDTGLDPAYVARLANRAPVIEKTTPYDQHEQTVTPGPGDLSEVAGAAATARQSQRLAASVERQNERIALLNQRIDFVLERIAGKKATAATAGSADEAAAIPDEAVAQAKVATPEYWWNWWASYTDTYLGDKQVSVTTTGDGSYATRSQLYAINASLTRGSSSVTSMECFAAGTPVATLTGPLAIEKLQIGDRVLAQDADTGELAYKLVLGATIRPPVETVLVTTTRGTIQATRGHPFWIVGRGWLMARELHVGDRLHCLSGGATVTAIEAQPSAPVYNLSVADYGTYFVGDIQALVHDNTPRLPTRAVLPGYMPAAR